MKNWKLFSFPQSYCQKHGKINTKDKTSGAAAGSASGRGSDTDGDGEVRRRKRKDMSSEEKNQARAAKWVLLITDFSQNGILIWQILGI